MNTASFVMWRTYFRLAFRNLTRDKLSTGLNVAGFAVGISCSIVAFVFMHTRVNLDTFHQDADRIFQVQQVLETPSDGNTRLGSVPAPLGPVLLEESTQVELSVRVHRALATVTVQNSEFEQEVWFADPGFLDLFTFPLEYGDPEALNNLDQVVLSNSLARRLFGHTDVVGEPLTLATGEGRSGEFVVGGVAQRFPNKRSFAFDLLVPFRHTTALTLDDPDQWSTSISATFLRVRSADNMQGLVGSWQPHHEHHRAALEAKGINPRFPSNAFAVENLLDIARNEEQVVGSFGDRSSLADVLIFFVLSFLILLLAGTSYLNMAIASAGRRIKEIGIRKVVGGNRAQLVVQFLTENLVLCFLAMITGTAGAAYLLIPAMNSTVPADTVLLEMSLTGNPHLWIFLLGLLLIVTVCSGAYLAFYIARFEPNVIFRGSLKFGRRNRVVRGLLVFQMVFTFILLLFAFTESRKSEKVRGMDKGYDSSGIVAVTLRGADSFQRLADVANARASVVGIAGARHHIGASSGTVTLSVDEVTSQVEFYDIGVGYAELMGLRLVQGRFPTESEGSGVLVNQHAVDNWNMTHPVGREVRIGDEHYLISGVVEDFPRHPALLEAQVLRIAPENYQYMVVKTLPNSEEETLQVLESAWNSAYPEYPFVARSQIDGFERDKPNFVAFGGILALMLSCMSNLGLVAIQVTGRRKELSVRKVLGASGVTLLLLMLKSFQKQSVVALAIAVPIGVLMTQKLLVERFVGYELSAIPFLMAYGLMLAAILLTSSTQLFGAVSVDPVVHLRAE